MTNDALIESKRERILTAAKRAFKSKGLAQASMRNIAKEAGCTTGAIYPVFTGIDEIYASLLSTSLSELNIVVSKSVATTADPNKALRLASFAFFNHYLDNKFDYELGLYLFRPEKKGVGKQQDNKLNEQLLETLDIFKACFIRVAENSNFKTVNNKWATEQRDLIFATIMGALLLAHSSRDKSIKTSGKKILETYLANFD